MSNRASTPPPYHSEPIPRPGSSPRALRSDPVAVPKPPLWHTLAYAAIWIVIALPALYQIGLLVTAISQRVGYPYDLEWMEGGMLHHAQRIRDGAGIYVPPSVDFIPYLYTPLYPSLLALFGGAFGVSYGVGRAISVIALIGIAMTAALQIPSRRHEHPRLGPPWAGVALGLGLFAAAYPITDGWYDLVRADTLFLLLVTAGIGALPRWCRTGTGLAGHAQVAASGAILALAFFCKQTGFFYVALGGVFVLVLAWRRLPAYVGAAGLLALGGTAILEKSTQGWFWTYVREVHKTHDFNMDRFWKSLSNILWETKGEGYDHPVLGAPITIVVVASLILVAVTYGRTRALPPQVRPLLIWSSVFFVSVLVGALGWATQFAHFNAYMPAFLHGGLAAGSAVPAVYACARILWGARPRAELVATGAAIATALPLAIVCITARWEPSKFIPTDADVAAGDRLIERLRSIEGEVWMPSHPWYAYMAGKTPRVHRMGIVDINTPRPQAIEGLEGALKTKAFSAVILDNLDLHNVEHFQPLLRNYRPALRLPAFDGPCPRVWTCRVVKGLPMDERPRLYTGAKKVPDSIWVPAIAPTPPAGAKALFDFEAMTWDSWKPNGTGWGKGPTQTALPGQGLVLGATGQRFATSMHEGDDSVGSIASPMFVVEAGRLTMGLGGGHDPAKLRVELWVDDAIVDTAYVPVPGGDTLRTVTITVPPEKHGKLGKLVFVDNSHTGHLDVDDVWAWPSER